MKVDHFNILTRFSEIGSGLRSIENQWLSFRSSHPFYVNISVQLHLCIPNRVQTELRKEGLRRLYKKTDGMENFPDTFP